MRQYRDLRNGIAITANAMSDSAVWEYI